MLMIVISVVVTLMVVTSPTDSSYLDEMCRIKFGGDSEVVGFTYVIDGYDVKCSGVENWKIETVSVLR